MVEKEMNFNLLSSSKDLEPLIEIIHHEEKMGFDVEFKRESTYFPITEIIQVASSRQSWLIDARAFKKAYPEQDPTAFDPQFKAFLNLFENPEILKVAHAAQGDQECLFLSFGVLASPLFDTAVAASLLGLGDSIGLSKLVQALLKIHLKKGYSRTNWSLRPLPEHLKEYAHQDVAHLLELLEVLEDKLTQKGRKVWAYELSKNFEKKKIIFLIQWMQL